MKPDKLAMAAKKAAHTIAHTPTDQKDRALLALGQLIGDKKAYLILENRKDIEAAEKAGLCQKPNRTP
jgi:gamma-glutamyl phosphate reductase